MTAADFIGDADQHRARRAATPSADFFSAVGKRRKAMAIGKRRRGGESLPILKYDARHGTLYTQDRVLESGSWESVQRDVTDGFRAIFDLANVQIGWIAYPKGAPPDAVLFPADTDIGNAPSDAHKMGLRLLAKTDDGVVRELLSTAAAAWDAVDELHDRFLAEAAEHVGEVPVVELDAVVDNKTNYGISRQPVFRIVGWEPRPDDMPEAAPPRPEATPKATPKAKSARADLDDEIPFS